MGQLIRFPISAAARSRKRRAKRIFKPQKKLAKATHKARVFYGGALATTLAVALFLQFLVVL